MNKHALTTAFLAALFITGCATQSTPAKSTAPSKPAATQKAPGTKQTTQQSTQQNQDDDGINYERPLIRGKK
ncbi:hypothetical protein HHE02_03080 [Helicobacter heilmannii]|uniref:hypothetical protein n=1 Tax=Helicobacter heilmannii TaxID=35817 RepID=UPI0006A01536|nr:hypothetical protein [Helicobacter heilmannii]CRF47024.1 hypothetical protein HHE02_03080 [Helicobacter heilmannii]